MAEGISGFVVVGVILAGSIAAFVIGAIIGRKKGAAEVEQSFNQNIKQVEARLASEGSFRKALQNEIDWLKKENERYIHLFVTFPEAVKRLNSTQSVDEVSSAIVRLAKMLIDADEISLFFYKEAENELRISLAFGIKREQAEGLRVPFAEGMIGTAADTRVLLSENEYRTNPEYVEKRARGGETRIVSTYAAPIVCKDKLYGVLNIGNIKNRTGNERKFLAMISDLAAVSLENALTLSGTRTEATTDPLTGLYNRRYFQERLVEEVQRSRTYNVPLSVFMMDIDNFKHYNDNNGHPEGDRLLKAVSKLIRDNTRKTSIVARYGGEEFIVLLPDTPKEGAMAYAEKMRSLISGTEFPHGDNQPLRCISVSGGVATFPFDGDSGDEIVRRADEGLYQSKERGRNRVTPYEPPAFHKMTLPGD